MIEPLIGTKLRMAQYLDTSSALQVTCSNSQDMSIFKTLTWMRPYLRPPHAVGPEFVMNYFQKVNLLVKI